MFHIRFAAILLTAAVTACSTGSGTVPAGLPGDHVPAQMTQFPQSVSPGAIAAPPMAHADVLAPATMTSVRRPQSDLQTLGFTQIPGAATSVAASPDGSIFVLSAIGLPSGDKFIFHYANGAWTNLPGAATRLAIGPDGSLWAVNSFGGIYEYSGGSWRTIAGGASDISIGSDGSVYVISSVGGGSDRAIWHFASGMWAQLPGAGVRIVAAWDPQTYLGFTPRGFFVTDSSAGIFYYNPGAGFSRLSGAAVQVAPTSSGGWLFALGDPANRDKHGIYYDNLSTSTWTQQPGSAVSIATSGAKIYAVSADGGIFWAPIAVLHVVINGR